MAGRGTDILLGGSAKGIARTLTKYLMLCHTKLLSSTISDKLASDKEDDEERRAAIAGLETDEDVLALPIVSTLTSALKLWMPTTLSVEAELDLKRAIVSVCDALPSSPTILDIEVENRADIGLIVYIRSFMLMLLL